MKYSQDKLRLKLKACLSRLKLLYNKKRVMVDAQRREIAELLRNNKENSARIRTEQIIREDYMLESIEQVEALCQLLLSRIQLIDLSKELDASIEQTVHTLIYAAPRMEAKELLEVRAMLINRYGKPLERLVRENNMDHVNERLATKLNFQIPSRQLVNRYLSMIADTYNVEWTCPPDIEDPSNSFDPSFLGPSLGSALPSSHPVHPNFHSYQPTASLQPGLADPSFLPPAPTGGPGGSPGGGPGAPGGGGGGGTSLLSNYLATVGTPGSSGSASPAPTPATIPHIGGTPTSPAPLPGFGMPSAPAAAPIVAGGPVEPMLSMPPLPGTAAAPILPPVPQQPSSQAHQHAAPHPEAAALSPRAPPPHSDKAAYFMGPAGSGAPAGSAPPSYPPDAFDLPPPPPTHVPSAGGAPSAPGADGFPPPEPPSVDDDDMYMSLLAKRLNDLNKR
ncbi:hypothetical protein H696_00680 [Fonticula alba]|uniref:IST1 homolog n=1 Tax=Fonticula alba TaxID=691883 RepID=A0A058ZHY6_FONAL|nr:hypothetical protein H696_00680 [Fonticula alba]KCV73132.1 hypothetical protein H696_00680 [Fonticula alba]|eukprot:XP_009492833.1 hypothetical protein H696_00680 [Fonticula alba]